MTKILQLTHFIEHDRVAQMQIRCGGIQTKFDAQWLAVFFGRSQLLRKFGFDKQFVNTPFDDGQCLAHLVGKRQGGGCGGGCGGCCCARLRNGIRLRFYVHDGLYRVKKSCGAFAIMWSLFFLEMRSGESSAPQKNSKFYPIAWVLLTNPE